METDALQEWLSDIGATEHHDIKSPTAIFQQLYYRLNLRERKDLNTTLLKLPTIVALKFQVRRDKGHMPTQIEK